MRNQNTARGGRRPSSSAPSDRHRRVDRREGRRRPHTPNQKRPNALKHGVFAVNPAIPGEDPREFQELFSALVDEWQPSGPTEVDAVSTLADAMWRKLRAQKFRRAKVIANTLTLVTPLLMKRVDSFFFPATCAPRQKWLLKSTQAATDKINHLKQKFPRSNWISTEEWAEAIITEIITELVPAALGPSLKPGEKLDYYSEAFRKAAVETRLFLCIIHAREFLDDELNVLECLDGRIARAVKHLVQTKGMKKLLRQTSAEQLRRALPPTDREKWSGHFLISS